VATGVSLIGVDAKTGKLIWRFPWKTEFDVNAAMPVVSGNTVFITSGYNHGCALVAVNGKNAKAKWESKAMQSQFCTPILSGGFLYGTSGDNNKLVCLEMKTGKVRWEHKGFEKGGAIAADGTLIAFEGGSGNLVMVKLAPDKYQELGRFRPLGGQSWTAPILADGKLIIRNQKTLASLNVK
jgi:outer membrane protein assembly factor BamB